MLVDQDEASLDRIERCRRINRKAAAKCGEHGVAPDELAIAAVYSSFDLAEAWAGRGMSAIEWLRTALDVMEENILNGEKRSGG
nr:hypothetical protein [Novosphingobium panipatense]